MAVLALVVTMVTALIPIQRMKSYWLIGHLLIKLMQHTCPRIFKLNWRVVYMGVASPRIKGGVRGCGQTGGQTFLGLDLWLHPLHWDLDWFWSGIMTRNSDFSLKRNPLSNDSRHGVTNDQPISMAGGRDQHRCPAVDNMALIGISLEWFEKCKPWQVVENI